MSKSVKVANPSDVRAWAKANVATIKGLPEGYVVGERGRLHPLVRKAYDKAHPRAKYVESAFVERQTVKGVRVAASGRKVPFAVQVNVAEAREALLKAGKPVGKRGRIAKSLLTEHAATLIKG